MNRLYLAVLHALGRSPALNRLRQLFPRRYDEPTGHGGFCYKPNGDLLYIPPPESGASGKPFDSRQLAANQTNRSDSVQYD